MKKTVDRKGFTIVELVIVIAVIAVLAAVLIPTFADVISKAKDSKATQEAKNAYTQFMIENAQEGELSRFYIFKSDNKRYVTLIDGAVKGIYRTKEKAVDAIISELDDKSGDTPVYSAIPTNIKNLFEVEFGEPDSSQPSSPDDGETGDFDGVSLDYGNKYESNSSKTLVSTTENVYLYGGENVVLKNNDDYVLELVMIRDDGSSVSVNSIYAKDKPISNVAPSNGWYGVVISKIDGSEFNFEKGDSKLLGDYAKVIVPLEPEYSDSGLIVGFSTRFVNVYLETGDKITIKDGYRWVRAKTDGIRQFQIYYGWTCAPEIQSFLEGWTYFSISINNQSSFEGDYSLNLYDYITIERARG